VILLPAVPFLVLLNILPATPITLTRLQSEPSFRAPPLPTEVLRTLGYNLNVVGSLYGLARNKPQNIKNCKLQTHLKNEIITYVGIM
jgi:hypothetical protein